MPTPTSPRRSPSSTPTGSQVELGNVITVPINQSIIYVQPLYVQAQSNPVPRLVDVIVVYNGGCVPRRHPQRGAVPDAVRGAVLCPGRGHHTTAGRRHQSRRPAHGGTTTTTTPGPTPTTVAGTRKPCSSCWPTPPAFPERRQRPEGQARRTWAPTRARSARPRPTSARATAALRGHHDDCSPWPPPSPPRRRRHTHSWGHPPPAAGQVGVVGCSEPPRGGAVW